MGHIEWTKPETQSVLKLILKSSRFVPFGANLSQFGAHSDIHEDDYTCVETGMVGLAPKWVRLDPKLEKPTTCSSILV